MALPHGDKKEEGETPIAGRAVEFTPVGVRLVGQCAGGQHRANQQRQHSRKAPGIVQPGQGASRRYRQDKQAHRQRRRTQDAEHRPRSVGEDPVQLVQPPAVPLTDLLDLGEKRLAFRVVHITEVHRQQFFKENAVPGGPLVGPPHCFIPTPDCRPQHARRRRGGQQERQHGPHPLRLPADRDGIYQPGGEVQGQEGSQGVHRPLYRRRDQNLRLGLPPDRQAPAAVGHDCFEGQTLTFLLIHPPSPLPCNICSGCRRDRRTVRPPPAAPREYPPRRCRRSQ